MTDYALITGSTSGIGKSLSELMAQKGHDLILVSRSPDKLAKQKENLVKRYNVKIKTVSIDLSTVGASEYVFVQVRKMNLHVTYLVNNAGFNECGEFISTNLENEKSMIRLHIDCTTELIKLFLPGMLEKKHGRILNLGSTGSYMYCPNDAVYAATKAYTLHFSKALKSELARTGVSVTTLCPGSTRTEFASKAGMENTLLFKLLVMDSDKVARHGYNAMIKGRTSIITGLHNKVMVLSSKILPSFILDPITKKMLKTT